MLVTEYIAAIVKPLLNHPDDFTATESQDEMGILVLLSFHKEDMGPIIGRNGETINAVRKLVRAMGMTTRKRVSLIIKEPSHE